MNKTDYLEQIAAKVRDIAEEINNIDIEKYLDEAIAIYSKYKPLEKVVNVSVRTPGTKFNLPVDWENGFSCINSIIYPIELFPLYTLPSDVYEIFLDEGNIYRLRFVKKIVSDFDINYTIRHSFNNSNPPAATIPDCDFFCVCYIASGIYLQALANRYCENINPTIGSSSINYDDKSAKYRKLAGDFFLQAANWLGLNIAMNNGFAFELVPVNSDQKIEF